MFKTVFLLCALLITAFFTSGYYYPLFLDQENPNIKLLYPHQTSGLPIENVFEEKPGCYLLCYSTKEKGKFKIGQFELHGLVRVQGTYPVSLPSTKKEDRLCTPSSYQGVDLRQALKFVKLCNDLFPGCKGSCYPGKDTGSFYFR